MKIFYILFFLMLWMIFSENLTLEILLVGFLISCFICAINRQLLSKTSLPLCNAKYFLKQTLFLLYYIFVLLVEVTKANFQVAAIVLSRKIEIKPKIIAYKTDLKSNFSKTILANSITLTPGTLTLDFQQSLITIHCLDIKFIDDVVHSKFEKILLKMEGLSL